MTTVKKHGGSREGSGRKPATRKKTAIFIYVYEDQVEAVGGKEAAKVIGEQAVTRKAKNSLKKS